MSREVHYCTFFSRKSSCRNLPRAEAAFWHCLPLPCATYAIYSPGKYLSGEAWWQECGIIGRSRSPSFLWDSLVLLNTVWHNHCAMTEFIWILTGESLANDLPAASVSLSHRPGAIDLYPHSRQQWPSNLHSCCGLSSKYWGLCHDYGHLFLIPEMQTWKLAIFKTPIRQWGI